MYLLRSEYSRLYDIFETCTSKDRNSFLSLWCLRLFRRKLIFPSFVNLRSNLWKLKCLIFGFHVFHRILIDIIHRFDIMNDPFRITQVFNLLLNIQISGISESRCTLDTLIKVLWVHLLKSSGDLTVIFLARGSKHLWVHLSCDFTGEWLILEHSRVKYATVLLGGSNIKIFEKLIVINVFVDVYQVIVTIHSQLSIVEDLLIYVEKGIIQRGRIQKFEVVKVHVRFDREE